MEYYKIAVPYEGYSRGDAIFEVEADSEKDAIRRIKNYEGHCSYLDPIRDDTTKDLDEAGPQNSW